MKVKKQLEERWTHDLVIIHHENDIKFHRLNA